MKTLADFNTPFDAILAFEQQVAEYTGAPYCVTTDCCTHAIEIAFRLAHDKSLVKIPARTYLSVPMTMHKLGIKYEFVDHAWHGSYQFLNTRIYDCARKFQPGMYKPGSIQCVSFGVTKPLQIGLGGCILTDDKSFYEQASCMRFDGRDIFQYSPWLTQKKFHVGYHYYLRPEECIIGLNLLKSRQFIEQTDKLHNYPDCREIEIYD
jgi:dTDP-4-amino-4,6-dideoxygalactose transaminase